ncbi:MAG: fasciclin domain-containing protein [Minisyncoccota bacterium]
MTDSKTMWVAVVVIVILGALGYWWAASGLPLSSWAGFGTRATSTAATRTAAEQTPSSRGPVVSTTKQDVASIVAGLSGSTQFKSWFASTGVAATITKNAANKYTIFVPTDGSVSQLTPGTITGLSAAEKKRLVQYHIISGRAVDTEAQVAGQMQALSGDMLNFNFGENGIPMVNSSLIVAQYNGTNGTVYVIDNVLFPPKKTN